MGGMGIVVRWHICSIVFILRTARIYSPPFFLRDYRDFLFTPTFILIFHVKYLILPFLVLLPLFIHYTVGLFLSTSPNAVENFTSALKVS